MLECCGAHRNLLLLKFMQLMLKSHAVMCNTDFFSILRQHYDPAAIPSGSSCIRAKSGRISKLAAPYDNFCRLSLIIARLVVLIVSVAIGQRWLAGHVLCEFRHVTRAIDLMQGSSDLCILRFLILFE